MISIDDALDQVLAHSACATAVPVSVLDAVGLVLAEDVKSDIDSPPHDKALVDGYAVRSADVDKQAVNLRVIEQVTAGQLPTESLTAGTTIRVMTGAPIPTGSDAMIMVEHTRLIDDKTVFIEGRDVRVGSNIMAAATSLRRGDTVVSTGTTIRPIEVGLLSEVGRTQVLAFPRPKVAILATGNELVEADRFPPPGAIRNSNGPMLNALVGQAGGEAVPLGIATDDSETLMRLVSQALDSDVTVLSGGVSAGVLDLVPSVLARLDVRKVFHRVNLKPGKPLWFGSRQEDGLRQLVFGLPGNPVSSLVCFELFVRPALAKLAGRPCAVRKMQAAILAEPFIQRANRPTYHPSVLDSPQGSDCPFVEPLNWHGSADLKALIDATCLAYFPAGERTFAAGESIDVLRL